MVQPLKKEIVSGIEDLITSNSNIFIMHYQGLTVTELSTLRKRLKTSGAQLRIAKNTLVKRAMTNTNHEPLNNFLTGPTAIAFSQDPVGAAKVLVDFSKENEKLKILGGAVDTDMVTTAQIKELASTPPLNELRAKLLSLLNAPATKLVRTISEPAAQLVRVIAAHSNKA